MHVMIKKWDKWIHPIISEFPGHFADLKTNGFQRHHHHWMALGSGFSMVVHHWSDNGMVTDHCWSLVLNVKPLWYWETMCDRFWNQIIGKVKRYSGCLLHKHPTSKNQSVEMKIITAWNLTPLLNLMPRETMENAGLFCKARKLLLISICWLSNFIL